MLRYDAFILDAPELDKELKISPKKTKSGLPIYLCRLY
ncbi:hypothetical protein AM1_5297 [Acaryochloris marina MBIC11017]|uniref:Uncharacterized protein n=1 Tax=Acaryochloris marina (strain MBIC 11017) TaxID=329726 RepID=B0CAQ4_ACAM1|nr:hypothetical protein AM1_5297 [Acaryochloris marina MBIC11017]